MALIDIQKGLIPLGQYDVLDSDLLKISGGEILVFASVDNDFSDLASSDSRDGYTNKRTLVRLANENDEGPFLISDKDGPKTFIGSPVGIATEFSGAVSVASEGQVASGKTGVWFAPGIYGTDKHALTSGQLANPPAPGAKLYVNNSGLLTFTPSASSAHVGTFISLSSTNESLVTGKINKNKPILTFLKRV